MKLIQKPSPKQTAKRLVYFPTIFRSAIKITLNAIEKTLKNRKIRIIKSCVYVIASFLGRILILRPNTEPLGWRFRKLGYLKLQNSKNPINATKKYCFNQPLHHISHTLRISGRILFTIIVIVRFFRAV